MTLAPIEEYLQQQRQAFENSLVDLLKIASVSADPAYHPQCRQAANWVHDLLKGMGLQTELIETPGQPLVYAESPDVPGAPTVLVYGHYDVQPPDPLNEWLTPPFEPSIRNGNIHARGATDDKGQMITHLLSAQAWLKTVGKLPVKLKFLIEGEEESGGVGIHHYLNLPESKSRLACDIIVISDTSQFAPGQPAITYGLRGIAYYEVRLTGPKQDLHSGTFGGAVTNPANALVKILAQLVDSQGRIAVPGFYDEVVPLSEQERKQLGSLTFKEQAFMDQIGVSGVTGEAGFTTLERRWGRPTCDINGLWSGYQGEGAKTVLPARAGAKFSFRLVPKQDPQKITQSLTKFLESLTPPGIKLELIDLHGAGAAAVPLESPYMSAAAKAIEQGFGTAPVLIREGGSIPIVTTFSQKLGVDTLLLGWGLDDDNTHSPNEKFCLADFHRGIKSSAYLWQELSKIKKS